MKRDYHTKGMKLGLRRKEMDEAQVIGRNWTNLGGMGYQTREEKGGREEGDKLERKKFQEGRGKEEDILVSSSV